MLTPIVEWRPTTNSHYDLFDCLTVGVSIKQGHKMPQNKKQGNTISTTGVFHGSAPFKKKTDQRAETGKEKIGATTDDLSTPTVRTVKIFFRCRYPRADKLQNRNY